MNDDAEWMGEIESKPTDEVVISPNLRVAPQEPEAESALNFMKTVRTLSLQKWQTAETPEDKEDALLEGYDDLLAFILTREPDYRDPEGDWRNEY